MAYNTQNHLFSEFCLLSGIINTWQAERYGTWVCFRLQVRPFYLGPNGVGEFVSSLESRNRSSCRKVMFSSYLVYRTIDKVQKTNDSEAVLDSSGSV
jgi:hypothetical protein